jgi:hypothetical protein
MKFTLEHIGLLEVAAERQTRDKAKLFRSGGSQLVDRNWEPLAYRSGPSNGDHDKIIIPERAQRC